MQAIAFIAKSITHYIHQPPNLFTVLDGYLSRYNRGVHYAGRISQVDNAWCFEANGIVVNTWQCHPYGNIRPL